ncbi:hypothetical protein C8F04DRAFT_1274466 [Mycena alexandri]|uniref:Uncharacterized protein n=1 Tax=Mycena alexandri TaxID=1745969 RepID=A0AAD6WTY4_9AGAR|nr:hypothetical protein C8F04DRAFT_1274466 [Mycena alexandri]
MTRADHFDFFLLLRGASRRPHRHPCFNAASSSSFTTFFFRDTSPVSVFSLAIRRTSSYRLVNFWLVALTLIQTSLRSPVQQQQITADAAPASRLASPAAANGTNNASDAAAEKQFMEDERMQYAHRGPARQHAARVARIRGDVEGRVAIYGRRRARVVRAFVRALTFVKDEAYFPKWERDPYLFFLHLFIPSSSSCVDIHLPPLSAPPPTSFAVGLFS